jgi:hypothetical protein
MVKARSIASIVLVVTLAFGVGYFVGQQPESAPVRAQTDSTEELFEPFFEVYDLLNQR